MQTKNLMRLEVDLSSILELVRTLFMKYKKSEVKNYV